MIDDYGSLRDSYGAWIGELDRNRGRALDPAQVRAVRDSFDEWLSTVDADHRLRKVRLKPDLGWKWLKWTVGFWSDPANHTFFGIDFGPLEVVWRWPGYRP